MCADYCQSAALRDYDYPALSKFVSSMTSAVTTLVNAGFHTQLDNQQIVIDLKRKLSPLLRSSWGKYQVKLPVGVQANAQQFMKWIQKVHDRETKGQLLDEQVVTPPSS